MKKRHLLLLFLPVVLFCGFTFTQSKPDAKPVARSEVKLPAPVIEPTVSFPKSIDWNRHHHTTTHKQLEDLGHGGPKKGTYLGEKWIDKRAKKSRFELFKSDGTLQYAYTADDYGVYEFDFDPKTKIGRFIQKPNSGRMDFESDQSQSAKEHFETWKKQIEEGYRPDETLEETKVGGRAMYKITSYFSPEYNKPKAIRTVTLIDKETYLTYQYMSAHDGKQFTQISTYNYLPNDFSDDVFTLTPPKGYTLSD